MKCEFFDQKQTLALLKTLVHPDRPCFTAAPVPLRSCPQNNSILIPPLHFLPLLFYVYIFLLALIPRPLLFLSTNNIQNWDRPQNSWVPLYYTRYFMQLNNLLSTYFIHYRFTLHLTYFQCNLSRIWCILAVMSFFLLLPACCFAFLHVNFFIRTSLQEVNK